MGQPTNVRRGTTLIELVVVLAVLGLLAAIAGVSFSTTPAPATPTQWEATVAALRDSAVTAARPVTAILTLNGRTGAVTAYPDGQVLSELGTVERTTGRVEREKTSAAP